MKRSRKIFPSRLFPIAIRRVVGHSMQPALQDGDIVVFSRWIPSRIMDVAIAQIDNTQYIKRITNIDGTYVSLHGDNPSDSLNFPRLSKQYILGPVLFVIHRSSV